MARRSERDRPLSRPSRRRILDTLLERHGETYAAELGIDLGKGTPSVLFRWLCASILLSARISAGLAMQAARALADQGWTTAEKIVRHDGWDLARVQRHLFDEGQGVARAPDAIHVIVTGGAGYKMSYLPIWGGGSETVTRAL